MLFRILAKYQLENVPAIYSSVITLNNIIKSLLMPHYTDSPLTLLCNAIFLTCFRYIVRYKNIIFCRYFITNLMGISII